MPSLESYECKCNPQNEQCNKAEEIPINFIEHRMQQQLQQLGPVASVGVEADNEEDVDEEQELVDGDSLSSLSTTAATTRVEHTPPTTKAVETTMIDDYQEGRGGEESASASARQTPFALPIKDNREESKVGVVVDVNGQGATIEESKKDEYDEYYYAAYDDENVEQGEATAPTLASILNIPKSTRIPISQPSTVIPLTSTTLRPVKSQELISDDSETTRWSSITRDGQRVSMSDAMAEETEKDVDGNDIWDDEDDDDDDDDFEVEKKKQSAEEHEDEYFEKEVVTTEQSPSTTTEVEQDDSADDEDMYDDLEDFLRPFKIVLPPWRDDKTMDDVAGDQLSAQPSPFDNPNAADPFLKSREFLVDLDRMMKGKEDAEVEEEEQRTGPLSTPTSVRPEPTTRKTGSSDKKKRGSCFTGIDSFFHYSDGDTMRRMSKYKLDINLRFKSHSSHGLLLWTGRHAARINDNFLLLGIENG